MAREKTALDLAIEACEQHANIAILRSANTAGPRNTDWILARAQEQLVLTMHEREPLLAAEVVVLTSSAAFWGRTAAHVMTEVSRASTQAMSYSEMYHSAESTLTQARRALASTEQELADALEQLAVALATRDRYRNQAETLDGDITRAYDERDRLERDLEATKPVVEAAKALVSQSMLVKGDAATWGDVSRAQVEGPKLLKALMTAVDVMTATAEQRGYDLPPAPS